MSNSQGNKTSNYHLRNLFLILIVELGKKDFYIDSDNPKLRSDTITGAGRTDRCHSLL